MKSNTKSGSTKVGYTKVGNTMNSINLNLYPNNPNSDLMEDGHVEESKVEGSTKADKIASIRSKCQWGESCDSDCTKCDCFYNPQLKVEMEYLEQEVIFLDEQWYSC